MEGCHEQSSRDSLSADVADGDADACFLAIGDSVVRLLMEDEEVVVVAADRTRRAADAVQIEASDAMCMEGEEISLDLLGDGDLVLQAFLFFLFYEQTLQRARHGVERTAELG